MRTTEEIAEKAQELAEQAFDSLSTFIGDTEFENAFESWKYVKDLPEAERSGTNPATWTREAALQLLMAAQAAASTTRRKGNCSTE